MQGRIYLNNNILYGNRMRNMVVSRVGLHSSEAESGKMCVYS